jgi:hypothetical protein
VRVSSSTDPVGVRVLTERESRGSSVYFGALRFTAGGSDREGGVLQVSDGDTVTAHYLEPDDSTGGCGAASSRRPGGL